MRPALLWALAFAAGLLGWRVAAPAPAAARAAGPSPAQAPHAVAAAPASEEARELRRKLDLVARVPVEELVLHGKEPLGDRMRRARGLPGNERRETLREWARRAVYDRAKAQEMLALVREEEDREILLWLAEMIDVACLGKMTDDPTFTEAEQRALFPLAVSGDPFERRIAALRVVGGDRFSVLPAETQALLADVLRRDPEPLVVAAAAEEVEQRYSPDAIPDLLPAWRRLPPGEPRQRVARAHARWAEWPDLKERLREARGPVEYDEWARTLAGNLHKVPEAELLAIYRDTTAKEIRRDIFYALSNRKSDLLSAVAEAEPDGDLRGRYRRALAAEASTPVDVFNALYR